MPIEEQKFSTRAYRVRGRVQGVGFRWWTKGVAKELDLGGSVRNLPDGSVEVHVAGLADRLDAFEARLREGPRFARVDGLEALENATVNEPNEFEIEV